MRFTYLVVLVVLGPKKKAQTRLIHHVLHIQSCGASYCSSVRGLALYQVSIKSGVLRKNPCSISPFLAIR